MAIADKLVQVNQVKQDIKTAIETKGIPMTNVAFTEYANKILEISSGGDMSYEDYARTLYLAWGQISIFQNAWEHSLGVDISEIEKNSDWGTTYGSLQYPNGETEGVIIPEGTTKIGEIAFYNWNSNNQPLVIPNSVTSINSNAFSSWTSNNQQLVIPNSVTNIGVEAFRNWYSNNQPLVIPDSVTSFGIFAFYNWTTNTHPLVIPENVTSIGSNAFNMWRKVPYVEIKAIIPPSLAGANAFSGQNDAPIYVPDESVDDYKTATQWVNLADRIFPISNKE